MENIVVVDRIPQVGADRFDKLRQVLNKLFSKAGEIQSDHYPKDKDGNTAGLVEQLTCNALFIPLCSLLQIRLHRV